MATSDVDAYIEALEEPKRSTLTALRDTLVELLPDAEQCISYTMPAFRQGGKVVAGFAAFKHHLSYLPHSGHVLERLADETAAYTQTKGSLHFPIDTPLPRALVQQLVDARIAEIAERGR